MTTIGSIYAALSNSVYSSPHPTPGKERRLLSRTTASNYFLSHRIEIKNTSHKGDRFNYKSSIVHLPGLLSDV